MVDFSFFVFVSCLLWSCVNVLFLFFLAVYCVYFDSETKVFVWKIKGRESFKEKQKTNF